MKAVHDEAPRTWSVTDVPSPGHTCAAIDALSNDPTVPGVIVS